MISAIIVDDEVDGRVAMQNLVDRYCPDVRVMAQAFGVEDAYAKILECRPDLTFLDIKMDDGSAFDLLRRFEKIDFKIIFVTAFDQYAIEAIRYSAFDYLLKPVQPSLLVEAIEKLKKETAGNKLEEQVKLLLATKNQRDKIALPASDGLLFVKIADIVRCEADSSYTRFILSNNQKVLVSRTLKDFEEILPATDFFRVHKSHLVNLNYIKQYINRDGGGIVMENDEFVPIARNRKDYFLQRINL